MKSIRGIIVKALSFNKRNNNLFCAVEYEEGGKLVSAKVSVNDASEYREGDVFLAKGKCRPDSRNNDPNAFIMDASIFRISSPTLIETIETQFLLMFNERDYGVSKKAIYDLINQYGKNIYSAIENNPNILLSITNDKAKYGSEILNKYMERHRNQKMTDVIQSSGLTDDKIESILSVYKKKVYEILNENPYRVVSLPDLSFEDADMLGSYMGIDKKDVRRLEGAVHHALTIEENKGSTYANLKDIISGLSKKMDLTERDFVDFIQYCGTNRDDSSIVIDMIDGNIVISLRRQVDNENTIAQGIARLLMGRSNYRDRVAEDAEKVLQDKPFDEIQKRAVIEAVANPLFILTGGPGTGKTTVTKAITELCKSVGDSLLHLTAPTGKAARRLKDATSEETSTLHRLLAAKRGSDNLDEKSSFGVNASNPLEDKSVVFIDEGTMSDASVMAGLFRAMPDDARLVMIGDKNQLPSVGAGAVLSDMLSAAQDGRYLIPSVELENVYRTESNSKLATDSYLIRDGLVPEVSEKVQGGVVFMEEKSEDIEERLKRLVTNHLMKPMHLNGKDKEPVTLDIKKDVAILCPQAPGVAGTWRLNTMMSKLLNPDGKDIPGVRRMHYDDPRIPLPRIGDRIIMSDVDNDPDLDVNNGDVGEIIGVLPPKEGSNEMRINIHFDTGVIADYEASKWRNLLLSYAMTIHKSQGSQYPVVILPLTMAHYNMLDRALLYTGWTRTEKLVCCIGEKEAFRHAIENKNLSERNTRLRATLENIWKEGNLKPLGDLVPNETIMNKESLESGKHGFNNLKEDNQEATHHFQQDAPEKQEDNLPSSDGNKSPYKKNAFRSSFKKIANSSKTQQGDNVERKNPPIKKSAFSFAKPTPASVAQRISDEQKQDRVHSNSPSGKPDVNSSAENITKGEDKTANTSEKSQAETKEKSASHFRRGVFSSLKRKAPVSSKPSIREESPDIKEGDDVDCEHNLELTSVK